MKELQNKESKIINAQFRSNVGRVVLTLANRDVVFAHPKVLNNTLGLKLDPIATRKLIGGTLYYEATDVKAGEEFRWNNTADEVMKAESDLAIRNVVAVIPTDTNEAWLTEHCEAMESAAAWDDMVGSSSNNNEDDVPEGAEEEVEDSKPATKAKTAAKAKTAK